MTAALPDATVWSLLFARWLLPTEGGAQGETLWLTSLTLFAAALVCWIRSRNEVPESVADEASATVRRSLTKLDLATLLLCGSHVVATLLVLVSGGNRRTALNLGWEWAGLITLFLLLRHACRGSLRHVLVRTLAAIWIALAGYGIWQNFIWYPTTLKTYEQSRAEYDAAMSAASAPNASASSQRELRQATAKLAGSGVPLSGPARELFERRLRDSQEPLGFFALANSFSGCLSVVVILLTVLLVQTLLSTNRSEAAERQGTDPARAGPQANTNRGLIFRLLAILLPLLLTAGCLILTKSRTAWCGTLAGLFVAAGLAFLGNRSTTSMRRVVVIVAGLIVAIGGLAGTAVMTGGLDANVLREAPKSLKYRLEYWSGTLSVIGDQPLLGVGPGQFRDAYLKHKLPESSEEIADPHQAILDVWSNAGLPALLGLLALIGTACWNIVKGTTSQGPTQSRPEVSDAADSVAGPVSIVLAAGIVFVARFVLEAAIDSHVLAVGVAAIACWWLIGFAFGSDDHTSSKFSTRTVHIALAGGLVALFVHLQGAGGIAMPAVIGLLLLLALLTEVPRGLSPCPNDRLPRFSTETQWTAGAATAAVLSVACSLTGFVPDQSRRSLLAAGDYEAAQGRAVPHTERLYHEAAQSDVLSPEPWLRLSELAFRQWSTTGSEPSFDQGLEAALQAINRSPHTASIRYHVGHWLLRRAERDSNADLARQSVEWLTEAVAGYPTEPRWLADLALAQHAAGDTTQAASTARQALELDATNREAGHIDRYLDNDTLGRLAEVGPVPTGQTPD